MDEEQRSRRTRWAFLGTGLGALLLLGSCVLAVMLVGPAYPREKAAAFDRLRQADPVAVIREARALMADHDGDEGNQLDPSVLSAALRQLDPIYVLVGRDEVRIKMGGMGEWYGFIVLRESRSPPPDSLVVTDGLLWEDSYAAPEHMHGLPPGW